MKLHLGCGKNYKSGYINIDQYDSTVADKVGSVINLDFNDNSVDHIEASHVLEHLGYFPSLFGLYEWFRVLKPEGTLIIEIPNIESTFQRFLEANKESKNRLLVWVFGRQKLGMGHKFVYYRELLIEKLNEIGFEKIKMIHYDDFKGRPVLKISCQKAKRNLSYLHLIAKIRRILYLEDIYNSENEEFFGDFEEIIASFQEGVKKFIKSGKMSVQCDNTDLPSSIDYLNLSKRI